MILIINGSLDEEYLQSMIASIASNGGTINVSSDQEKLQSMIASIFCCFWNQYQQKVMGVEYNKS